MAEAPHGQARRSLGWWLDRTAEGAVVAAFVTFVVLSFVQVVLRYGFGRPLTWTEEVSRYLFVWVVFVGTAVAARHNAHIALDFLVGRFPPPLRRGILVLMGMVSLAMLVLLFIWYGWVLTAVSMRQESPATGIPVGWATLAIPVGGLLTVVNIVRVWRDSPVERAQP
jgi:TRAP-type C4-dicarboxylate transport system permease small subunit